MNYYSKGIISDNCEKTVKKLDKRRDYPCLEHSYLDGEVSLCPPRLVSAGSGICQNETYGVHNTPLINNS